MCDFVVKYILYSKSYTFAFCFINMDNANNEPIAYGQPVIITQGSKEIKLTFVNNNIAYNQANFPTSNIIIQYQNNIPIAIRNIRCVAIAAIIFSTFTPWMLILLLLYSVCAMLILLLISIAMSIVQIIVCCLALNIQECANLRRKFVIGGSIAGAVIQIIILIIWIPLSIVSSYVGILLIFFGVDLLVRIPLTVFLLLVGVRVHKLKV